MSTGETNEVSKMDSEDMFWLGLWRAVIAGLCLMTAIIGGCCANTELAVSRDIRAGLDPLTVRCAHNQTTSSDPSCSILAAKR